MGLSRIQLWGLVRVNCGTWWKLVVELGVVGNGQWCRLVLELSSGGTICIVAV